MQRLVLPLVTTQTGGRSSASLRPASVLPAMPREDLVSTEFAYKRYYSKRLMNRENKTKNNVITIMSNA